jgi:hypothetical protein
MYWTVLWTSPGELIFRLRQGFLSASPLRFHNERHPLPALPKSQVGA